jgi:enediyne biosynthesis protein E4
MKSPSSRVSQLLLLALLGIPGVLLLLFRAKNDGAAAMLGFTECAEPSGLNFKMAFLPGEQGENFKVNLYDHGCGIVVGDYDADGHDDVLLLNQLGSNGLFRNRGDGTFVDVTHDHPALALADRICVGGAFGDYDNDGDQDIYITSSRGGNVLFENTGAGSFHDITAKAGVSCVAHSQTAAFFDYDNDGDLDLFVTNTAKWTSDALDDRGNYYLGPKILWEYVHGPEDLEANVLFRNNGDRTFSNATRDAGLEGQGWSGDVAVFDFDEDGDVDIFVTNMFGMSQLYANDGHGRFADVTRETLRRTSYGAIGCKVFDYDNDGKLDLFLADMHSDMWMEPHEKGLIEPRKKYRYVLGRQPEIDPARLESEAQWVERMRVDYDAVLFGNSLFHNDGQGKFTEVSDAAGMETFWPWGVAVGDFDNDGYQDAYLPSGMGYPYFYHPSYLMMNNGDGTFQDEAAGRGMEPPPGGRFLDELIGGKKAARSSRCAATADFDADGRLDLVVNNFNDRAFYFKNEFAKQNFAKFRLVGTRSNRDAIGAVVKLFCGPKILVRQVQCSGGYLSQSTKTLHFGLGDCQRIDRAEIRWPSGVRQRLDSLRINELTEVREPEPSSPKKVEPAPAAEARH